jgi:flagellar basal-body rod protein FlgC
LQGFAVPQAVVEPSGLAPRRVYEPGNPYADAKGYVAYAGVDTAAEMVAMMSASRSYEANIAAMNMSKTMALKALQIGESAS